MASRHRKRKARPAANSLTNIFGDEWSVSDDWVEVANQMCAILNFPDLTTRNGLKDVHADLEAYDSRLNQAFKYGRQNRNFKIMGGVVAVWTKMCTVDSILQDRLIDAGLLERVMTLTENSETLGLALRFLNVITFHFGKRFALEFRRYVGKLISLWKAHVDDPMVPSLVLGILAHSPSVLQSPSVRIELSPLVENILETLRQPALTSWLFDHAMAFFGGSSSNVLSECKNNRSYLLLCVAMLRSHDLNRRMQALRGIWRMSSPVTCKYIATFAIVGNLKKCDYPSDLSAILGEFGQERTEALGIKLCMRDYVALHSQNTLKPDPLALGRALGAQIMTNQFSVPQKACTGCARLRSCACCSDWNKCAPECIVALRAASEHPSDLDLADALEWKSTHCEKDGGKKALQVARNAISRVPSIPFFYYAVASQQHNVDHLDTLRVSKKGLKCPDIPLWIRTSLLRYAINSALHISTAACSWDQRANFLAMLISAHEDSCELIRILPPDSMFMQGDLSIHIIVTLLVRGPECAIDGPEMQEVSKKSEINNKFMDYLGIPLGMPSLVKDTRKQILDNMSDALQEWKDTLEITNGFVAESQESDLTFADHDESARHLDTWLSNFEDEDRRAKPGQYRWWSAEMSKEQLTPMRCTWCERTSAVLKKCGQCGTTRYCDSECQKSHWAEHKSSCQGKKAAPQPTSEMRIK
ncbi:unnamed protein product [Somion occarium]